MATSSHPQQAGPIQISPHIKLQPPLSRLGHGPGLVLVLDHYALIEKSEKHLDPPPLQKWAEEGFAVAQMLVPGKAEDGGEFNLQKAIDELKKLEGFDDGPVGVICTSLHASDSRGNRVVDSIVAFSRGCWVGGS
jgi:carboxymethylenebutenolidase